jgi:drug/metabolite transporter (DMT)-like permease
MTPAPTPASATAAATLKRAVLMAATAEGFLALLDAIIKMQSAHFAVPQLSFMRFAMGSLFAAAWFLRQPAWPSREATKFNVLRSLIGVGASLSFFTGLSLLPLAEAMAISFAAPLVLAVLSVVFLGERVGPRLILALLAGFIGMLVIVGGQMGAVDYTPGTLKGALAVLLAAVFYAIFLLLLRVRASTDPLPTMLLFQNLGPAIIMAIPAALVWQPLTLRDFGLFVVAGALGIAGHACMIMAFARAEAARLAPVHYVALLWGTLYGWLFFGHLPGVPTLIGAALVVAATLLARKH